MDQSLGALFRKILLVSVKFLSAILGPEMAAPILWTPGKIAFFLQENRHVHKIPRFRGGGYFGFWRGGGSADFIFMGAGIFLTCFEGNKICMDQSPESMSKVPLRLALVHGWFFPAWISLDANTPTQRSPVLSGKLDTL